MVLTKAHYVDNRHWLEFIDQFPSGKTYESRMEALVDIHFEKDDAASIPLHQSIEDYIKSNHARDENGKFRYSSSTLRTWLSVFKKWYEITGEYPAEIKQIC